MSSQIAYDVDATFGCWLWTGQVGSNGRPIIWRGRRPSSAYKVVYEIHVGPVPDGLELDHGCRNPMCIAPHHLEPVTESENGLRKSWKYRASKQRCKMGHDLNGGGAIVTPHGGRVCRQCNADAKERA